MIFDSIDNMSRYGFTGNMKKAVDYLRTADWNNMSIGTWNVDGENVRCTLMDKEITDPCLIWESHERYADIHFLLSESEIIRTVSERCVKVKMPLDRDRDAVFYENIGGTQAEFALCTRDLLIIYPGEIHQPNNLPNGCGSRLRKVVMKVLIGREGSV